MVVVVGIDGSEVSKIVLAAAMEEARWRGADLHVVHVLHLPVVYGEFPVDYASVAEAERGAVWGAVQSTLEKADVVVERVDLDGYPPDALVDYAGDVSASLLVVGSRGRGELAALVLGSTSHRAIHLATCDVLVVKAEVGDSG